MAERYIDVMLAVNGEGGVPQGFVEAAHFPADIEMEAGGTAPVFRREEGKVRIGRHVYPIRRYQSWVGNWHWDMVSMPRRQAVRLARNLIARDFTLTAASDDYRYPDLLEAVGSSFADTQEARPADQTEHVEES